MADVTEVIHKITYEVNNDALNNATQAMQAQITELNKLAASLNNYKMQMAALNRSEVAELDKLSGKIDDINRKIAASAGKLEGTLKQVGNGILKGLGIDGKIENAVEHLTASIVEKFSKVEKLDFKSIAGLAGNLLSFTGVAPLAISFIADMAIGLFNTSKAATAADKAYVKFLETISNNNKSAKKSIDEQLGDAKLLINTAQSGKKGDRGAAQQLKSQYSSIYGSYSVEQIMSGQAGPANSNLLGQLENREISNNFKRNRVVLQEKLREEQAKEGQALRNYETAKKNHQAVGDNYNFNLTKEGTSAPGAKEYDKMLRLEKEYNSIRSTRIIYQKLIKKAIAEEEKYASNAADLMFPETDTTSTNAGQTNILSAYTGYRSTPGKKKPEKPARPQEPVSYMETGKPQLLPIVPPSDKVKTVDAERMIREQREKEEAEAAAKRKENIKSAIDDYKVLSEAAVEAYNTIIQAQIDALDKEISLRGKRVEEAKSLAEKGNVEALRIEEERLRKAQEQRARFARQQQIVNSAITVSNAIAAVARAALEGGGFGSAATIAALIAALAAGYAAVTSMSNDGGESFADGVVGYNGKGGPRDDKNWVRISNGESVITAAGTHKNRALLEAINSGATLHMIEPSLPFVMPLLKQPGQINSNAYASAGDLRKLEGKLDDVVGAIQDNKLRQNIFFNEHGVGIMTEKAIKKEQRRWK